MTTTNAVKETTAAKLLVAYLKQEGVEYIFGIPGGPLMPLYEALFETGWIKPILAKHEEGAAFMADGYARASGKLGVCCATTGPGATNLITGVACAYADSIPLLVLTAQVATSSFGKGAAQESTSHGIDIVNMFKPVTKSSIMLHSPEKMGEVVRAALRSALCGRKGPVHINLPADFMKKPVNADIRLSNAYRVTSSKSDRAAIIQASKQLIHAKRPVILAGHGVNLSGANEELRRLAEKLNIPVVTSPKAKGAFPENHALSLGVFGFVGSLWAEKFMLSGEVDVLVAVGTSLGELTTCNWDARFAPSKVLIQIDIDPCEIGKNYPTTLGIEGDAKAILQELSYQIERDLKWTSRVEVSGMDWLRELKSSTPNCMSPEKIRSLDVPLKPQRIMSELRAALPSDAVLFVDIGTYMTWAFQYFPVYEPGTFYINLGLASMGHAVAACVGGKLARPDKPVVALTGDCAFAMNGMEVHTAVDNEIPVIWVVVNNGGHGMVHHGESIQFGGKFNSSIFRHPLHIAEIARGLGAVSMRAINPGEVEKCVGDAIKLNKPCVIEVLTDNSEVPPMGHRIHSLERMFAPEADK
jgi:acetolactate synthase I/II/III large subunit